MSEVDTAEPSILAESTIFVLRTIKLGSADAADKSGDGATEVLEVHKFATAPAFAEAGLSIRKSQQTENGDWVAGEVTLKVNRPCYTEELEEGTAVAYAMVKDAMSVHLPKMLTALNQLSKR